MQLDTVATVVSGDSGWIWSMRAPASWLSLSRIASTMSPGVTPAIWRTSPTGVNSSMLRGSMARFIASWKVSRWGTSMLSMSIPCAIDKTNAVLVIVRSRRRHCGPGDVSE